MYDAHLSEEDIQQFAFNSAECSEAMAAHLEQCAHCRAGAEQYRLVFSGIEQQEKPVFDTDLTALVLEKIAYRKRAWPLYYYLCIVSGLLFILLIYWKRIELGRIFKKYVLDIASGLSLMAILLLVSVGLCILLFQFADIYRKYRQKMKTLNGY